MHSGLSISGMIRACCPTCSLFCELKCAPATPETREHSQQLCDASHAGRHVLHGRLSDPPRQDLHEQLDLGARLGVPRARDQEPVGGMHGTIWLGGAGDLPGPGVHEVGDVEEAAIEAVRLALGSPEGRDLGLRFPDRHLGEGNLAVGAKEARNLGREQRQRNQVAGTSSIGRGGGGTCTAVGCINANTSRQRVPPVTAGF